MKKIFLYLACLALAAQTSVGQVKARSQSFSIQPPARPAALSAAVELIEPSGNTVLDPGEKGTVKVTVTNTGGSPAQNVLAKLTSAAPAAGVQFRDAVELGELAPNGSKTGTFDISAAENVQSMSLRLTVDVSADKGVKGEPKSITVNTRAALKPAILAATAEFIEPSGNKILDAGEKGTVKISVSNNGGSTAKNVLAKLSSAVPSVGLDLSKPVRVGDVTAGKTSTVQIEISALSYVPDQSVVLSVEVSADDGIKADPRPLTVATRAATKPAALASTLQFAEPSGNGALDAGETGTVTMSIANSGGSPAKNVVARIKISTPVTGISFPPSVNVGDISAKSSATAQFPLQASEAIPNQNFILIIEAADAAGAAAEPKSLAITTREKVLARDVTPPDIEIWEPVNVASRGIKIIPSESKYATSTSSLVVRGIAKDSSGVAVVSINGQEARLAKEKDGFGFLGEALLVLGDNDIEVRALDRFKNEGKVTFKVTRNPEALAEKKPIPTNLFRGQRWAVIVGISRYRSSDIPQLRYADRDAQDFYGLVTKPIEEGGVGIPKSNVRFLLNDQATSSNVRESITDFLKQPIEDDLVIIYFAGHGAPDPDRPRVLYLLTHDSDLNRLAATSVKMQEIQDAMRDYVAAKSVLVFADACHSRGVTGALATRALASPDLVNEFLSELARARASTLTFSASDVNQLSQEDKRWGGGHGVFTHYLIEGLTGKADLNSDKMVRLGELTQFVSDNVRRETRSQQSPISSGNFDINLPLTIVVDK